MLKDKNAVIKNIMTFLLQTLSIFKGKKIFNKLGKWRRTKKKYHVQIKKS